MYRLKIDLMKGTCIQILEISMIALTSQKLPKTLGPNFRMYATCKKEHVLNPIIYTDINGHCS